MHLANQHLAVDATGVSKSFGSVLAVDDITVRVAAGEVYGPVYEFDGCFDPNGDNAPTGVAFPSLLGVASTTVMPDAHGDAGLQLTCGSGDRGCAGSVTATAGHTRLGTMPVHLKEESTTTLPVQAS